MKRRTPTFSMNRWKDYRIRVMKEAKGEIEKYVVTAKVKGKRDTISKPMSEDEAKKFKENLEAEMKDAVKKYQWAKDIKVEKV